MKGISLSAFALLGLAEAFPAMVPHAQPALAKRLTGAEYRKQHLKRQEGNVPFDAAAQYVSTSGEYAWVEPTATDQRGPCPGLNAMANHGYIPHNGVATIQQYIDGTTKVFGMGVDLAGFLAVYGAIFDGDLTSWSIGGPAPGIDLDGLLGVPQGLSGSHNKYENDVSPTRGDLYQYGNTYTVQVPQFQQLFDLGKAEDSYTLEILEDFRASRFQQSITENPYFFNGIFSGVLVQPAAYTFIYRFMANKSEEAPEGILDGNVLKSFFSITGDDGDFTYTHGYERIPDNWYKRNDADAYTIPFFMTDVIAEIIDHPEFASIGGNTGTVNSFTGLDPSNLTQGVFNSASLTEGNNLQCFVMQQLLQEGPDILTGLFTDTDAANDLLGSMINNATDSLGCPQLNAPDKGQFSIFPGYTQTYNGYSTPDPDLV